jgi:hypothetical protein
MLSHCFHCIVLLIDLWCIEKTLVFQWVRKGCANTHRTCMHNTLIVHSCTPHVHPCTPYLHCIVHSCTPIMPSHAFPMPSLPSVPSHALCLHMPSHAFDHAFTCPIMPSHAFTCLHMPSHAFTCLHMPSHAFTCLHMPSHAKPCASPSLTFSIAFYIFSIVCRFAVLTS